MSRRIVGRSIRHRAALGSAMRALALATAAALLGGCGQGSGPAPSASATPKPVASAPARAAAAGAPSSAPASTSAPMAVVAAAPAASGSGAARLAGMSEADLLGAARTAYAQHRLVAPKGDNAMEYYEEVLARDPGNQVAKDALREIFPFAVPDVEKVIAQNDYAEAGREIDLMAKADPANYTLTLLRSKLDAQQKLQARQQQEAQQKSQKAAEALAAQQRAAAQQQAAAAEAERAAAQRVAEQQQAAAAQAAAARAAAEKAAAAPPKPAGVTRGAEVVSAAEAAYPVAAARNQTSGFVVVKFTVNPEGGVSDVKVVDSSPRSVFDNAAEQAIRRSKFKPALKDGEPVAAVLQRRIDFRFNQ